MAKKPSSDFTEAVRAFFNETNEDLMSALFLIEQIRAELELPRLSGRRRACG